MIAQPAGTRVRHQSSGKMRSTWYYDQHPKQYKWAMKVIQSVQKHDVNAPPAPAHYGKIPTLRAESGLARFLPQALLFVAGQFLIHRFWQPLTPWLAVIFWTVAYNFVVGGAARTFISLGDKWGFLDGQKERDKVPDYKVTSIALGFIWSSILRIGFGVYLLYDPSLSVYVSPLVFLPKLFVFAITVDLFFYTYHRSCHEIGYLWKFHSTHHLTKHPSASLALLADPEQETIEVLLVPLAATLLCRHLFGWLDSVWPGHGAMFSFYDWAVIITMINVAEVIGHTGVRAHIEAFNTAFILRHVCPKAVLVVEDHDMHHRHGWKKSGNYGKQSLWWDYLFGTLQHRPEGVPEMLDWQLSVFDPVPHGHTNSEVHLRKQ